MQTSSSRAARCAVARRSALALLLLVGCKSPDTYRAQADEQVYALIDARRAELFSNPAGFNIDPDPASLRQRILRGEWHPDAPLTLLDCLDIAAENNRDFQTRKEQLYLVALDLTLERWQFKARGFAGLGALLSNEVVTGSADYGFTKLLGSGASIVGDIGVDLFRIVTTGGSWESLSRVGLSITQPLLQGGGALVTQEPLTQAERNLVYSVRDFERFRRTFAVDVESRVLDLLQRINELENEDENYANLVDIREQNEALVEAGRLSSIEADQARQQELRSETNLIGLRGSLERRWDDFNIFLGLPVGTRISLDPAEFANLRRDEPLLDAIVEHEAVGFALGARLDYRNQVDQLDDQVRRVAIAENALLPGLSVTAAYDSVSTPGVVLDHGIDLDLFSVSVDYDFAIDRMAQRNAYRRSLISLQAAQRNAELEADQITANVRDAIRNAKNARSAYVIENNAATLADRRVESTRLNFDAGRAITRDVLEAQESLVDAQNTETAALVAFELSLLDLGVQLEALRVDETGIRIDEELIPLLTEEAL